MPEKDKYKAAWNDLTKAIIKHGKMFPSSILCDIPWNMMKEIERKHSIPSAYTNKKRSK